MRRAVAASAASVRCNFPSALPPRSRRSGILSTNKIRDWAAMSFSSSAERDVEAAGKGGDRGAEGGRNSGGSIVSLLPSATEILFFLGLGDRVAGVTFECKEPLEAAKLPHVTNTIVPAGASPGEIDAVIRDAVASGKALYTLDKALLRELDPSLIVSQDLCHVCALPSGSVQDALEEIGLSPSCSSSLSSGERVFSYDPKTLQGVFDEMRELGRRAGAKDVDGRVDGLESRLVEIRKSVTAAGRPRPRVLLLEWVDPPFTPGHWIPDQIEAAGGVPLLAHAGGRSSATTWEACAASNADVLIVAPCGFDQSAAEEQLKSVLARPELADLPAVRSGRTYAIDADAYVVRPGPRLVDGVAHLAELIHKQ